MKNENQSLILVIPSWLNVSSLPTIASKSITLKGIKTSLLAGVLILNFYLNLDQESL